MTKLNTAQVGNTVGRRMTNTKKCAKFNLAVWSRFEPGENIASSLNELTNNRYKVIRVLDQGSEVRTRNIDLWK